MSSYFAPLAALAAFMLAPLPACAQPDRVPQSASPVGVGTPSDTPAGEVPQGDTRSDIVAQVAAIWAVPAGSVRIELPDDAPVVADSVRIAEGSGDRWITTFWMDGGVVRRFVRVGSVEEVATATADLPRGHVVGEEDFASAPRTAWGAPKMATAPPVGWVVQRRIRVGEALRSPAVRPPLLVRGGDEVEAVLERDGVVLNIRAEALASARSGDPVAVRMPSGRRMEGRVVGPGRVLLNSGAPR